MNIQMYKNEIEKKAALGATLASAGAKALSGAKTFAGMNAGKRMLAGSALGATMGGVTSGSDNKISSMAKGAVGGAIGGAAFNSKNLSEISKTTSSLKDNLAPKFQAGKEKIMNNFNNLNNKGE